MSLKYSRSDDFLQFCLSFGSMKKKEKSEQKKKGERLVIRSLKSHRISAYRFLPIGEGRAVGKIEANGKKEGGKKGKGYK